MSSATDCTSKEGRSPFLYDVDDDDVDNPNECSDGEGSDRNLSQLSDYQIREGLSRSTSELEALEGFEALEALAREDSEGMGDSPVPSSAAGPSKPPPEAVTALLRMVKEKMAVILSCTNAFIVYTMLMYPCHAYINKTMITYCHIICIHVACAIP